MQVHGRCRWLRTLLMSNGYFHSAMRNLPVGMLGIALLHLPFCWSRLQYLAESKQEQAEELGCRRVSNVMEVSVQNILDHFARHTLGVRVAMEHGLVAHLVKAQIATTA